VESVVIHPDGSWTNKDIDTDHPDAKLLTQTKAKSETPRPSLDRKISFGGAQRGEIVSLDDDDDDNGAPTPASLPPTQPRLSSTSVRASPSQTPARKRGPPQIVDLTLSDDDDDTPQTTTRPLEPPSKRLRVEQINNPRTSLEGNRIPGPSTILNGVSPSSTTRESHIRSPPSSISPRNEHTPTMRFNQPPISSLDIQPHTNLSTYTRTPSITSPGINPAQTQLPSPTQPRASPYYTIVPPALDPPRSRSASPVLPAFSPRFTQPSTNLTPNIRFDWDTFSSVPATSGRTWDSDRDELENEDLDLEMARLPSSMFDAQPPTIDYDDQGF